MKYLLDTNIIIYWLNGNVNIEKKIIETGIENTSISFISLCELYYGAHKSMKKEVNINTINKLTEKISVIHSNNNIAETFGLFKSSCSEKGRTIDGADLLIASFALANNLTLITNNTKHFKDLENLKIDNWI